MNEFENYFLFKSPKSEVVDFYNLNELKNTESLPKDSVFFLLHAFDFKKQAKRLFGAHKTTIPNYKTAAFSKKLIATFDSNVSKQVHIKKLKKLIDFLKESDLSKVVLARKLSFEFDGDFPVFTLFQKLCSKYPSAFNYVLKIDDCFWLGASPELFLEAENAKIKTFSLAGTIADNISENPEWSDKEKEEQSIVTEFIAETLLQNQVQNLKFSPPRNHKAGKLWHLLSEIEGEISKSTKLDAIVNSLHPTPAVCGFPKNEAFDYIERNEGFNRELYCGVMGLMTEKKSELFVNLRCIKIEKQKLHLFVGGGITSKSDPEKEWYETEEKSKTMLDAIKEII